MNEKKIEINRIKKPNVTKPTYEDLETSLDYYKKGLTEVLIENYKINEQNIKLKNKVKELKEEIEKMKIEPYKTYSVGRDTIDYFEEFERNHPNIEYIVYEYEVGSWDGGGSAILKTRDGQFYNINLDHCSCYGPGEWKGDLISLETILDSDNILDDPVDDVIRAKVRQLEGK